MKKKIRTCDAGDWTYCPPAGDCAIIPCMAGEPPWFMCGLYIGGGARLPIGGPPIWFGII